MHEIDVTECEDEPPLPKEPFSTFLMDFSLAVTLKTTEGKGQGIFASLAILKGTKILKFAGPILTTTEVRQLDHDHFIQIDKDLWLGPSGLFDDYVNHSCNPNSALLISSSETVLIAIKDIEPDEEITFDYSPFMIDEEPIGPCRCGSSNCRGMIELYQNLDPHIQDYLEKNHCVPQFAIDARIKKYNITNSIFPSIHNILQSCCATASLLISSIFGKVSKSQSINV